MCAGRAFRLDREDGRDNVINVNQIEEIVRRRGDRTPRQKIAAIGNSSGTIDPRQTEDERPLAEHVISNDRFRRQRDGCRLARRATFRLFIDPLAVGLSIHAGRADMN